MTGSAGDVQATRRLGGVKGDHRARRRLGRRPFEDLAPEHIELERTRILEGENGITHMRYRVRR